MATVSPLPPEVLFTHCTLDHLAFKTTDDLDGEVQVVGQERAIKAIELGISIDRQGYNIFALGSSGVGKYTLLQRLIEARAAKEPPPSDWCYVYNFQQPYIPNALRLPPGTGKQLQRDMEQMVDDLRNALSSAFESEEYQTRRRVIEQEFQERQQASLKELQDQAKTKGVALLRTPAGLAFAPLRNGEVLPPEEFQKLPEEDQRRLQTEVEALQQELQKVLLQVPRWEREFRGRLRELQRDVANFVLNDLLDDLLAKYQALPEVTEYLKAVQQDVIENLDTVVEASSGEEEAQPPQEGMGANLAVPDSIKRAPALRRYQVNVLVDSTDAQGAPVIYENNPSYLNLVGRIEQMAMMGALITDFMLIKPGVLHRANGGYLILDALRVLSSPYAWEGLKRALQFRQIRIESPGQMLSMTSTVSLEPEPITLEIKVVLMGDRNLYYMLAAADPDFAELFKVAADFDDEFRRDQETMRLYAQMIASVVRKEQLRPFTKDAVCRVIDHGSRLVEDSERVTARMQSIVDLLQEADHWAGQAGASQVEAKYVEQAIDAQIYRSDRIQQRMQEEVMRGTILIDTSGAVVGQINGLSVIQMGNYAFGRPSRITASVRMGNGEVVNIEREVELSGPLHSKGVLILASFLRARYAANQPLSLGASLVFEQSYGGVDGDSASSAELYALLSAIAGVPIKQSLAVTGSVNQYGQVQAIGGVNEKIEGFFDLCAARGLTGEQGALIPVSNVKHLMLRHDVVEAVAQGKFSIYPVATIDEGIELLTGIPAGVRGEDGLYPVGTINRMVEDRLAELADKRKAFDAHKDADAAAEGADKPAHGRKRGK